MITVFWDTNVLLDLLKSDRKGHLHARELLETMQRQQCSGQFAWHSLSIIEYIGMKTFGRQAIQDLILELLTSFEIPKSSTEEAKLAFQYISQDLEDALQISSAVAGQAYYFVTNDLKGFTKCPIKVMSPKICAGIL